MATWGYGEMSVENFSWDASSVPRPERFEAYVEHVCRTFTQLEPVRLDRRAPFHARVVHREVDGLGVTQLSGSNHLSRRTPAAIERSPSQDFFLNYVAAGTIHVRQGSGDARVTAGGLFILDNARPFELAMTPGGSFRATVLRLGRPPWLDAHTDRLPGMAQALHGHRLLPLLTMNLAQLAPASASASVEETAVLGQATHRLLALMCAARPADAVTGDPGGDYALICLAIERNLGDPEFSLGCLANRLGMSSRRVQRVLARQGQSFSAHLRERRLSAAAALLKGPRAARSIEAIAEACGFTDLSGFYRSFKRRFGATPGDLRPR